MGGVHTLRAACMSATPPVRLNPPLVSTLFSLARAHTLWQFVFYAVPLALMLWISLYPDSQAGAAAYTRLYTTSRYAGAIVNSVQLGLIAASIAVAAGLPRWPTSSIAMSNCVYDPTCCWPSSCRSSLPMCCACMAGRPGSATRVSGFGSSASCSASTSPGILFTQAASVFGLLSVLLPIATLDHLSFLGTNGSGACCRGAQPRRHGLGCLRLDRASIPDPRDPDQCSILLPARIRRFRCRFDPRRQPDLSTIASPYRIR